MSRKLTTKEFKEKARIVHGDKYDYSKTIYINTKTKVIIICPNNHEFLQTPNAHLRGQGCPFCNLKTFESQLILFRKVHGDKYTYDESTYVNTITKMRIICLKHNEFWQTPYDHIRSKGCPTCGFTTRVKKITKTFDDYLKEFIVTHGHKYTYDVSTYKNSIKKMRIICPIHGEFWLTPSKHLMGQGCNKCLLEHKYIKMREKNLRAFIKVHGDKYTYDWSTYVNTTTPMRIICSVHGEFYQTPEKHKGGQCCPNCKTSKGENKIKKILDDNRLNYNQQHKFDDCKNLLSLPFDFYLYEKNICVEYDGEQHFEPVKQFGGINGLKETQLRDKIKTDYCKENNIKLIRIPYWDFENIEQILTKELCCK